MESLERLLVDQLKDIYNAENQLIKALPRLAKKASSPRLREAITKHLQETQEQVKRLDQAAKILSCRLTGKKCAAMMGLIEEGKEILEMEGRSPLVDSGICGAAERVEHYEMAAYGHAKAIAMQLGQREVADLLQQNLAEEVAAARLLTEIDEAESIPAAGSSMEEPAEESMAAARG